MIQINRIKESIAKYGRFYLMSRNFFYWLKHFDSILIHFIILVSPSFIFMFRLVYLIFDFVLLIYYFSDCCGGNTSGWKNSFRKWCSKCCKFILSSFAFEGYDLWCQHRDGRVQTGSGKKFQIWILFLSELTLWISKCLSTFF